MNGVACVSVADCWAVGYYASPTLHAKVTEALHWNGSAWRLVPTPNPGGTGRGGRWSILNDVACASARNCWAVGSYQALRTAGNVVLHWNGTRWTRVRIPRPGTGEDTLYSVACADARHCFAVGQYAQPSGAVLNQVFRWNGSTWQKQTTPNPGGSTGSLAANYLTSVQCISAANCWAVGSYAKKLLGPVNEALHWDGKHWQHASTPNPSGSSRASENVLRGVACASASSCVTTGYYYDTGSHMWVNDTLQWQGSHWTTTSAPNPAGTDQNELNAVACPAESECFAVGYVETSTYSSVSESNEVLAWDGTAWQPSNVPNPSGTADDDGQQLHAISCTSASGCWAVGQYYDSTAGAQRDQILHWNGSAWSKAPS